MLWSFGQAEGHTSGLVERRIVGGRRIKAQGQEPVYSGEEGAGRSQANVQRQASGMA